MQTTIKGRFMFLIAGCRGKAEPRRMHNSLQQAGAVSFGCSSTMFGIDVWDAPPRKICKTRARL